MNINRTGSAQWSGGLKDGKGAISTQSGALKDYPYGFASRFEGVEGTNPEELIAAAHAGCFTMALTLLLGNKGLTASRLDTSAIVTMVREEAGYRIRSVALTLKGDVPGADSELFHALALEAKANCPVSKLLNAEVTLDAALM